MPIGIYPHKPQQGFQKGNMFGSLRKGIPLGPMREEHKKKISEGLKGKMPKNLGLINANKSGDGNPMRHHFVSEEERQRRSLGLKNRWNKSNQRKKEMAKQFMGANNPRWRGGITPENARIRASNDYKVWRLAVFTRDNFTCQDCGSGKSLNADHIRPFAFFPELRLDVNNGRTLCEPCHKKTPTYMNRWLTREECEKFMSTNAIIQLT